MNADYLFVSFTPDWERRCDYHITGYPGVWSIYLTPVDPMMIPNLKKSTILESRFKRNCYKNQQNHSVYHCDLIHRDDCNFQSKPISQTREVSPSKIKLHVNTNENLSINPIRSNFDYISGLATTNGFNYISFAKVY